MGGLVLTLGRKAAVRGQDSGCASGRSCLLGCLGAAVSFERQHLGLGVSVPYLCLLWCLPRECISFLHVPSWLHNSEHCAGCWLHCLHSPEVWNLPGLTFCPGISCGRGSSVQQLLGSESALAHQCQPVQAPQNSPGGGEVSSGIPGTTSSLCISPAEAGPAGSLLGSWEGLPTCQYFKKCQG